jgi:N-formylmaleamate deformylase
MAKMPLSHHWPKEGKVELNENDVTANGIRLHVYRTGTDKPPLVFAHGRSDNGLCYWPIAKEFADDYEIILYDARDHGQSEKPESRTGLVDRAHDLEALVKELGLRKPGIIGHSLGAVTAALFAGAHSHIPSCIVLEDPPPLAYLTSTDEQSVARYRQWEQFVAVLREKSIQELVEMNRLDSPTWPESEREYWAQSKLQYRLKPFGEDRIDAGLGEQLVSQITCPVLLITADLKLGSAFPPQEAQQLLSGRANARHVNIPGAGHNIRREQPDAFLATVRDFLKGCEA